VGKGKLPTVRELTRPLEIVYRFLPVANAMCFQSKPRFIDRAIKEKRVIVTILNQQYKSCPRHYAPFTATLLALAVPCREVRKTHLLFIFQNAGCATHWQIAKSVTLFVPTLMGSLRNFRIETQ
jgi:hypothetical protein